MIFTLYQHFEIFKRDIVMFTIQTGFSNVIRQRLYPVLHDDNVLAHLNYCCMCTLKGTCDIFLLDSYLNFNQGQQE